MKVYHKDTFEALVKSLEELSDLHTKIILGYKKRLVQTQFTWYVDVCRSEDDPLFFAMLSKHFDCTEVPNFATDNGSKIFEIQRRSS
jgi:hypothetical protein